MVGEILDFGHFHLLNEFVQSPIVQAFRLLREFRFFFSLAMELEIDHKIKTVDLQDLDIASLGVAAQLLTSPHQLAVIIG